MPGGMRIRTLRNCHSSRNLKLKMSESQSKQLRVTLKRSDVTAEYGEDVVLSTDMKTVQDAISGVGGIMGPENCLKLGVAAVAGTAIYVLVKSIARNWSWITETKVQQDNVVEISAKTGKEERLAKLVKNGSLEKFVKNTFENLDNNLEGILGEEIYEKYGDKVLDLIKDIRIGSMATSTTEPDLPQNIKALTAVVDATFEQENYNKYNFLAAGSNDKGLMVGTYAGKGAKVKQVSRGGGDMLVVGLTGDDFETAANAHKELAGDCIELRIKVTERRKYFEGKFKRKQTIDEVVWAIEDEFKEQYRIFRGKEEINGGMTIAEAERKGGEWEAKK